MKDSILIRLQNLEFREESRLEYHRRPEYSSLPGSEWERDDAKEEIVELNKMMSWLEGLE